jgi:hypothetical protein
MPQLNTQPTYTSVYASRHPSRSAAQNSRPSGSLLLTREALSSSTSYRFIPAHPLPAPGITRLHRYYNGPHRHPKRPGLALTSCQLTPLSGSPLGLPVLRLVPFLLTCRRHYPGRTDGSYPLVPSHRHRPSPNLRRVGSCITGFGACSAFNHITACTLAKSPSRPSTSKASTTSSPPSLLRLLPGGANQFPDGIRTRCGPAPFTAH